MSLLVVGLSHRSAPVSVLERAALTVDAQAKLLHDTVAAEPAAESAVLATCNRIELYADVDKFHAGVAELSTLLALHSGVGLEELTPYLYVHYEDRAVHHLFSVACGLDSMVVGEGQILGQIKDSLARAQELHTAGRLLNDLFQQALRVGKRAHSETGIDRAGQSLVTFGLEQLAGREPVHAWAKGKRALVIGAGSMSSLAAATLARAGVDEVVVANRTLDRAERLAAILTEGGTGAAARAVPMDDVAVELTRADVAVSCTGATGLVLTAADVTAAVSGRVGDVRDVRSEVRDGHDGSVGCADDDCVIAPDTATATPASDTATPAPDAGDCPVGAQVGDENAYEQHAALVDNSPAVGGSSVRVARSVPAAVVPAARAAALYLLDLAMPRDIDAAAHRLTGVRLVDIESLADASADAPMAADVDAVRTLVSDEVAAFGAAQRAAHITPTVVALRTMAADVVNGEMARLDGRLPELGAKERAEITQTVRRVVDKLLHAPTVRVKQLASEPGGAGYADALRTLFDLDPETVAAVSRADLLSNAGGNAGGQLNQHQENDEPKRGRA
ncbi:glutamyl-tRNA reductase [Streptomyces aureoverticillatus]|uniref:glutamyl-tRNA reductase n=1 Tax=Streptomyces aureoverticillatus TaxID=66871 RepID=UPI0013D9E3DB|nr:glutamyl-tRNA reductase [Streptomyces aureoverticillatus]QIB44316.1 glutamyl-tRNA reductase [Streptomyces aureoverticillatus]